jgi:hypothetical protein
LKLPKHVRVKFGCAEKSIHFTFFGVATKLLPKQVIFSRNGIFLIHFQSTTLSWQG